MNKFIAITYLVDKPTLSIEESYVLKEIREDHRLFSRRMMLIALLTKTVFLVQGGRKIYSFFSSPVMIAGAFGLLIYSLSLESLNRLLLTPRLGYYLRLMQVGSDFSLGRDTLAFIDYMNKDCSGPLRSKELAQIT